ncbi:uncharacterized protein LOC113565190 isoform X2 [Drosophila persimilis]|uniref:uncharacterized protein LOC113565190 isoform X2 n=1 Tax=Drosophila persimilis TaxID=7234 RepID=UPI000F0866E8|nr:uncharacterized protein LOC113565190 isoform X2 [Drosophila persimilis]
MYSFVQRDRPDLPAIAMSVRRDVHATRETVGNCLPTFRFAQPNYGHGENTACAALINPMQSECTCSSSTSNSNSTSNSPQAVKPTLTRAELDERSTVFSLMDGRCMVWHGYGMALERIGLHVANCRISDCT